MAYSGLGQDGYLRYQKEVNYGTAITAAMTLLPVLPGGLFESKPELIENKNIISSRIKQAGCIGRYIRKGQIQMDAYSTLIGGLMNVFLGAATTPAAIETGVYLHTWLVPITGERIGKSMTVQQAIGGDTALQIDGFTITDMELSGDSSGNVKLILNGVGQGEAVGVARITTFTYPAVCPFNFGDVAITMNSGGAITALYNSFNLKINLGYNMEEFRLGSSEIIQPLYNTIPSGQLTLNVDADNQFMVLARANAAADIEITMTGKTLIGATQYPQLIIEMDDARLTPDTTIPAENDRLKMDLVFDLHGGTTTGSGTDLVMAEIRVQDATAAYA